jgi:putative ABC transport system permease protein
MSMEVAPILAALRRSKIGALLVVIQVALTLAIISNVISIVGERTALLRRPTGTDEHNLFAIGFRLTNGSGSKAALDTDLSRIRAVPGVVDAVATNTYPLRGSGWSEGISLLPGASNQRDQNAQTAVYAMDQHGIGTLGLHLLAGRNFTSEDVLQGNFNAGPMPGVAIVSRALARQLFPRGEALGKSIYLSSDGAKPVAIIGVVKRLQSPVAAGTIDKAVSENSIILPIASTGPGGLLMVRVKPGSLDATMPEVKKALIASNPERIFGRLRSLDEIRSTAYEKDRSMAIALGIVCCVLVLVTALGIVGLTSFWVARRKRQIGIRRALGATRAAIVRYFLIENALLCLAGVLFGTVVARGLNIWLWSHYGVGRLPAWELFLCALVVILLGQGAAVFPSLRAAKVEPTQALRSV